MSVHVLRLHPGQDLRKALRVYAHKENIAAGILLTGIGSLTCLNIRYADQDEPEEIKGRLEILSMQGMLSVNGVHIHVCIADESGMVYGGHLCEGSEIYTTAEIAIGELSDLHFRREPDPETGYRELVIDER